jgi:hypothetical protein
MIVTWEIGLTPEDEAKVEPDSPRVATKACVGSRRPVDQPSYHKGAFIDGRVGDSIIDNGSQFLDVRQAPVRLSP